MYRFCGADVSVAGSAPRERIALVFLDGVGGGGKSSGRSVTMEEDCLFFFHPFNGILPYR